MVWIALKISLWREPIFKMATYFSASQHRRIWQIDWSIIAATCWYTFFYFHTSACREQCLEKDTPFFSSLSPFLWNNYRFLYSKNRAMSNFPSFSLTISLSSESIVLPPKLVCFWDSSIIFKNRKRSGIKGQRSIRLLT